MSKKQDSLDAFLDRNAPIVFDALKSNNTSHYMMVMDRVFEEFLNVNLPKARTAKPKRKVRRGIGSY